MSYKVASQSEAVTDDRRGDVLTDSGADSVQNADSFALCCGVAHDLHPMLCDACDAVWQAFGDGLLVWRQLKKRRALLIRGDQIFNLHLRGVHSDLREFADAFGAFQFDLYRLW